MELELFIHSLGLSMVMLLAAYSSNAATKGVLTFSCRRKSECRLTQSWLIHWLNDISKDPALPMFSERV